MQTCLRLVEFHTMMDGGAEPAKVVMWAHNSHCGDARATELGAARDEWNLGQMMRQTYGSNNVFIVGFGTYEGTLTAASEWGEEAQTFELSPAEPGSYSEVLHRALPLVAERVAAPAALNAAMLLLDTERGAADAEQAGGLAERRAAVRAALGQPRRQRAVGVVYRKEREELSHYFQASMAAQVDAWIHVDRTTALVPLPGA